MILAFDESQNPALSYTPLRRLSVIAQTAHS
jgi:hypothetical protein